MNGKLFGYLTYSKYGKINTQITETNSSSTGNEYGIYNLANKNWEWTAGYIETYVNYEIYGGNLKGESSKYKTRYKQTSNTIINKTFLARGGESTETSINEMLSFDLKDGSGAIDIVFRAVLVVE